MFSPELMFNAWHCYSFTRDGAVRPGALEIFTPVLYARAPWVVGLPTLDKWAGKHAYYQENSGDDDWWNAVMFAVKFKRRYEDARHEYELATFRERVLAIDAIEAARALETEPTW